MAEKEMIQRNIEEFSRLQKYMVLTEDKESAAYREKYEKNTTYESALRTRCAERTRAMQLACMCASSACTVLFMRICGREDMEVHV